MQRDTEKQRDIQRKESRTDKQLQTQYSAQAVRAANDANLAYGFKFRSEVGR